VIGARGEPGSARVFVVADYAQAEGFTGPGDRALVSSDGGQTFSTLLEASGDLSSWSLSADGARLVVGGHDDGIYLLVDAENAVSGSVMTRVTSRGVHALAWGDAGRLFAAGHEASDGFSVGVSADDGSTFQPVFALCQVQGPLACPADSSVGTQCLSGGETGWDVRKEVADGEACNAQGELTGSAGASAEQPAGSVSDAGQTSSTPPVADTPAALSNDDAGCALAPARPRRGAALVACLALLGLAVRRRRPFGGRGSRLSSASA
jgi:hypothetical protein